MGEKLEVLHQDAAILLAALETDDGEDNPAVRKAVVGLGIIALDALVRIADALEAIAAK